MEVAFSTYTIAVMFVCAVACTATAASYSLTRNRIYLFAAVAFFLYFFDLSFIFQTENLNHGEAITLQTLYFIEAPYLKAVIAAGILESLWLVICSYLDEKNPWLLVIPCAIFIIADFLIAGLLPEGPQKQWLFYSMREVFLIWCLAFLLFRLRSKSTSEVERALIRRQKKTIIVGAALTCCIIAENTSVILIWHPSAEMLESMLPIYISERNFSENILVLVFAVISIRNTMEVFRLRHNDPPSSLTHEQQRYVESSFQLFSERIGLTTRERDVLRGIIDGKDNQNIASSLNLALGTVKSHTHNIFQKAGVKTRQELLQKFWGN